LPEALPGNVRESAAFDRASPIRNAISLTHSSIADACRVSNTDNEGVSAKNGGVRAKTGARQIRNDVHMKTTAHAIENLLCGIGDPVGEIRHIGQQHAEFNSALILRAAAGVIAKVPSTLPTIREALQRLDRGTASPAALAHAAAAEAWAAEDPVVAAERYAAIVVGSPSDLLALRLAQSCYFFLGWHDRFAAICDAVVRDWSGSTRGLQYALAMTAFAHAENDDTENAERIGRRALELNSTCPMGIHALAHAFAESGRHREGARWMREQRSHWESKSRMRTHNAWHLAMFDLENGDSRSALSILNEWLLPSSATSVLDACDATSLMWRLDRAGVHTGRRWGKLSDAFDQAAPGFWPYIDLHASLAHSLARRPERAGRLALAVEECARGTSYAALRAREITLPGLAAFGALADGRLDEARRMFARIAPLLSEAGGSRAQLEIFYRVGDQLPRSLAAPKRRGLKRSHTARAA